MRQCKECGATFVSGEVVCTYCGTSLVPGGVRKESKKQRQKDYSGTPRGSKSRQSEQNWDFSAFGNSFHKNQIDPPPIQMFASRRLDFMIAAILAFLLGTFGAHWFYLGRPKRAIWYLLFFWTGIPTLIGFVEGFMLARQGLISDL